MSERNKRIAGFLGWGVWKEDSTFTWYVTDPVGVLSSPCYPEEIAWLALKRRIGDFDHPIDGLGPCARECGEMGWEWTRELCYEPPNDVGVMSFFIEAGRNSYNDPIFAVALEAALEGEQNET